MCANIQAVNELSEIVRTSFGPNGRNKMVIQPPREALCHLGRRHHHSRARRGAYPPQSCSSWPASSRRPRWATPPTSCSSLPASCSRRQSYLITMGLHPSEISRATRSRATVSRRTRAAFRRHAFHASTPRASHSRSSRVWRPSSTATRTFCTARRRGRLMVLPLNARTVWPISAWTTCACRQDHGRQPVAVQGGARHGLRPRARGRDQEGQGCQVGVYTCGMDITQTETKGTVLLNNADELSSFARGEEQQLEKYFKEIADSGVTVVVTQSQVGELAQHYLNRFGISSSRSSPNSSCVVSVVCWVPHPWHDWELLCPKKRDGSIRSRPPRSVAIASPCSSRRTVSQAVKPSPRCAPLYCAVPPRTSRRCRACDRRRRECDQVPHARSTPGAGAGATELELAKRIVDLGEKTPGLNQHSIKKFGEALEVIKNARRERRSGRNRNRLAPLRQARRLRWCRRRRRHRERDRRHRATTANPGLGRPRRKSPGRFDTPPALPSRSSPSTRSSCQTRRHQGSKATQTGTTTSRPQPPHLYHCSTMRQKILSICPRCALRNAFC